MILHCLCVSPRHPAFADCLAAAGPADTILLLGDGVYGALPGSEACVLLQEHPAQVRLLREDAAALGVEPQSGLIEPVDMAGFVALTERHPRQLAWY